MEDFFNILPWIIGFAVVVGAVAHFTGRNGFGWFLLAALISPLIAGPLLLALLALQPKDRRERPR
jgi:hypothetical protein